MKNLFDQEQWARRGENDARLADLTTRLVTAEAAVAALPQGELGYAQVTATQESITTEVDLTGLTVTATAPAGRRIRVTGSAYFTNTGTTGYDILKIQQDGVQITERGQAADTDAHSVDCAIVLTPSAGSHTWKLRGQATAGTATFNAGATFPAFILVEDIGAA